MGLISCNSKGRELISLIEAMDCILDLSPLGSEEVDIGTGLGRVVAKDCLSASDCPSSHSSLKDGIAVLSTDVEHATPKTPVTLKVLGTLTAGEVNSVKALTPGTCFRIMTGSPIPPGAEAVLASEFVETVRKDRVVAKASSEPGRNILKKGQDIAKGELLLKKHAMLTPTALGLLAAGGVDTVEVFSRPRVAIAATGTELVPPGKPIGPGKVAASNMVTLAGELRRIGITPTCTIFKDNLKDLTRKFEELFYDHDVILTCGGVLDGDKDFTIKAMEELGVQMIFRRVRIGPGKGICMGRLGKKIVFNLPGGPPSNHVAAVVLALPGIKRIMGYEDPFPPRIPCKVEMDVKGQGDWTQFTYCALRCTEDGLAATHPKGRSRLFAMAHAHGLLELPEGKTRIKAGKIGDVWLNQWMA